jgi:hypothetical protein
VEIERVRCDNEGREENIGCKEGIREGAATKMIRTSGTVLELTVV